MGVGHQWDKGDHSFRSYIRQESLIDQYELLSPCALQNKKMLKRLSWYPNSQTLSNSNSGCGRLLFSNHHYLMPDFRKGTWHGYI